MKYSGNEPMKFILNTVVYLNWPKERMASMPISLKIEIERLEGPMLFILPNDSDPVGSIAFIKGKETFLINSHHEEPICKFAVGTHLGYFLVFLLNSRHKTKIKNIPKLSQFITTKLRKFIIRELVFPNGICFHIPIKGDRELKIILIRKLLDLNNNNIMPPALIGRKIRYESIIQSLLSQDSINFPPSLSQPFSPYEKRSTMDSTLSGDKRDLDLLIEIDNYTELNCPQISSMTLDERMKVQEVLDHISILLEVELDENYQVFYNHSKLSKKSKLLQYKLPPKVCLNSLLQVLTGRQNCASKEIQMKLFLVLMKSSNFLII